MMRIRNASHKQITESYASRLQESHLSTGCLFDRRSCSIVVWLESVCIQWFLSDSHHTPFHLLVNRSHRNNSISSHVSRHRSSEPAYCDRQWVRDSESRIRRWSGAEMHFSQFHRPDKTRPSHGWWTGRRRFHRTESRRTQRTVVITLSDGTWNRSWLERHGTHLAAHLFQGTAAYVFGGTSHPTDRSVLFLQSCSQLIHLSVEQKPLSIHDKIEKKRPKSFSRHLMCRLFSFRCRLSSVCMQLEE